MTAFRVDLGRLERVVAEIAAFGTALDDAVHRVSHHVDVVYESWHGQAATGHAAVHSRWQVAADELQQALQVMHRIVSVVQRNYEASVSMNTRMWRI